jgi:hypothetical protein
MPPRPLSRAHTAIRGLWAGLADRSGGCGPAQGPGELALRAHADGLLFPWARSLDLYHVPGTSTKAVEEGKQAMSHPSMTVEAAVPILQKRADWLAVRLANAEAEGVLAYNRVGLMALLVVIENLTAKHGDAPAT